MSGALLLVLSACGGGGALVSQGSRVMSIPSPDLWGGQVRCTAPNRCRLVAVEHSDNNVVVYDLSQAEARLTDRVGAGFHPDDAIWLDDSHVAVAVEVDAALHILQVSAQGTLTLLREIRLPFPTRNVYAWPAQEGGWWLLAVPYGGNKVAWVRWSPTDNKAINPIIEQQWCDTPWRVRSTYTTSSAGQRLSGLLAACYPEQQILYAPLLKEQMSAQQIHTLQFSTLKRFDARVRDIRPTPDGRYWYATMDLGQKTSRYDTVTQQWQWLENHKEGAGSVAPLNASTVAWGWRDGSVTIVQYNDDGTPRSEKILENTGFPETLQWLDVDADGVMDLVVLNSIGAKSAIHYAPLAK